MTFHKITEKKINSFHTLLGFLRRLKIIGTVKTKTVSIPLTEFGKPTVYSAIYEGYDPSTKGRLSPDERLIEFFNRVYSQND